MPCDLNDQWQTPPHVLATVRRVMPEVGLDPATSPDNPVGALSYCTGLSGDCGLEKDWSGHKTVWLNHPYSQTATWLCKLYQAMGSDPDIRVINLAPMAVISNVGTRHLLKPCYVVPLGRVKFVPPAALVAEREALGKVADPGSPRSDVGLFMYRFGCNDAYEVAKSLDTITLQLHGNNP